MTAKRTKETMIAADAIIADPPWLVEDPTAASQPTNNGTSAEAHITLPHADKIVKSRRKTQKRGRHWFGPYGERSRGSGHPVMFGFKEAEHFEEFPEGGGYPRHFLTSAFEELGVTDPSKVLHLCSGSMRTGIRVDIRPETNPDVICDCRKTPFSDESFDSIMVDPPYSKLYAENLYGTGEHYPTPGEILKEAARLLRPGGRVGFLHFQVPHVRRPLRLLKVIGITTGSGYAIRAWSVFEKAK